MMNSNKVTKTELEAVEETLQQPDYVVENFEEFDDMPLDDSILRGIYGMGFEKPSVIQKIGIKPLLDGRDIIAQSQSGTGKTGTFLIGSMGRINLESKSKYPQVLILSPNRELTIQTYEIYKKLNNHYSSKCALVIGGTSIEDSMKEFEDTVHCVIGTPGRVYDLIKRYILRTENLQLFVLDEADEMLSKGFKEQLYQIFQYIPEQCQIGLFSATIPNEALELSRQFMSNPVQLLIKKENMTLEGIKQYYLGIESESWKLAALCDLYAKLSISQCVIFCNSRRKAEWLRDQLVEKDFEVACIHGEMPQKDRNDIMHEFKTGNSRVLIATDLIARGIDVQSISIVINYDLPKYKETYIHRIGRSGRYGRKGTAINFVSEKEYQHLQNIEAFYSTQIDALPDNIKDLI